MQIKGIFGILLVLGIVSARAAMPVMIQDFEKASPLPTVWVVNIPNENASVQLSALQPHDGQQALKLHYHFLDTGQYQYVGIPNKVEIQKNLYTLRFWLMGDNSRCPYGVRVTDASGETHQYSKSSGQAGIIDFTGWKEVSIDLASGHETWGGDKNGRIDYPISDITFTVSQPTDHGKQLAAEGDLFFDSISADFEKLVEKAGLRVSVLSPEYCSEVNGNTTVTLSAAGFKSVTAKCWKQGGAFGGDSLIATVALDADGHGSFTFPANHYPHGPITVRISAGNGATRDNCYLQLYNKGGISWNEGLPRNPPPGANGMSLVFADDFETPPCISGTNPKATYYDHKPPGGSQDFSTLRFTSFEKPNNPFLQVDSYLRIRASEKAQSSGLISSMKDDASGVTAKAPCYFECRFMGPNAIGTWPAFWLMTDYMTEYIKGIKVPCDELDVIEAYGGEGPHTPNSFDGYMVTPHCWQQGEAGKAVEKGAFEAMHNPVRMKKFGIPSTWFETFHTYGCKVTTTDTFYYCDNIKVGRHATLPLSKEQPMFFMINLATGGGWPVDLSRYHGLADMYVDFVRVYQSKD